MRSPLPARIVGAAAIVMSITLAATPASACGGLVGENGTIRLGRTTTLAAFQDGIERYVTSFEFSGTGAAVGSIVPLPGVPTLVERGGDWTLQRLEREVAPPRREAAATAATAGSATDAQVLQQTKVDALDITILKGGGDEVGRWAIDNGFLLTPDAPEVLDAYSQRSQIFMAAKFDASRAQALGQQQGDGTPIMLTIPTDHPWVPLRILGLGAPADQLVQADVFVLTDRRPRLLGGPGLDLARSEPASQSLLDDLRRDKGMSWVPESQWLSYLRLDSTAGQLGYDLATSLDDRSPSLVEAGYQEPGRTTPVAVGGGASPWPTIALIALIGLAGVAGAALLPRARRRRA